MYRPDVVQLRQFYATPLGQMVRQYLTRALHHHWPSLGSDSLLALGYATPYVRAYLREETPENAPQIIPAMPAAQGAIYWPSQRDNRSLLIAEHQLPIANNHLNRLLLIHMLEYSNHEQSLLAECWRVLAPGGRMLVMVPHRRSVWAGVNDTPFSYGQPYSTSQLRETLSEHQFTHVSNSSSLFFWPTNHRSLLKLAPLCHSIGQALFPTLGGVLVMEVEKQIYAGTKIRAKNGRLKGYAPTAARPAMTKE